MSHMRLNLDYSDEIKSGCLRIAEEHSSFTPVQLRLDASEVTQRDAKGGVNIRLQRVSSCFPNIEDYAKSFAPQNA